MQRNREIALRRLYNCKMTCPEEGVDYLARKETQVLELEQTSFSSAEDLQGNAQVMLPRKRTALDCSTCSKAFPGQKARNVQGREARRVAKPLIRSTGVPNVTQEFSYLVVIDFEATCDRNVILSPQEIIEFPSVLVSCERLQVEDIFHTYVKPVYHPILTKFCRTLTGIFQCQVDGGVSLANALVMHDNWLEEKGIKDKKFAVLTWTDWDCKVMLETECKQKGLRKPPYFNRWINLKVPFQIAFNGLRCNLKAAVEAAGLKWEGRPHSGLDDAKNTARLALEVMRHGLCLTITNSFSIYATDGSLISLPKLQKPCIDTQNNSIAQALNHLHVPDGLKDGKEPSIFCFCGALSKKRMVKKPGPTHGKYFFSCGKWTITDGGQCHFFEWDFSDQSMRVESRSSSLT
eukprot:c18551_g1_i1 orf=339-1553(-)